MLSGSTRWIGVALLFVIVSLVASTIVSSLPGVSQFDLYYSYYAVPGGAISCASAYALYRSARSLAPMNHIQSPNDTIGTTSVPAHV